MNQELVHRYQEGYRAASSAIKFGNGIRAFGALLGATMVVAGLWSGADGYLRFMGSLLAGGVLTALVFAAVGVVVAAQGRILRGTLDTSAVINPMLAPHERSLALQSAS